MSSTSKKLPVAVVGATGLAGQQFLTALANHPQFELVRLAASARSAGKKYGDAIREQSGQSRWYADGELDPRFAALPVVDSTELEVGDLAAVFTAMESDAARELEPIYARTTPVFSTASAFRYESDVPILVPGVNLEQAAPLIAEQRRARGWKGYITPNPNCTTTGLVMTLKPLHQAFGVRRVFMTSMQSMSGAGRSPGVLGMDILDNVIPYISGEEKKVEVETRKILGTVAGATIVLADMKVSCTCTRVAVMEGHTESVFVELGRAASQEEVRAVWDSFGLGKDGFLTRGLPSAPRRLIITHDDPFRPQPRLDRDNEAGMATTVGRLRKDDALDNGWKYLLVSHNTKMGAAKGAVLVAEALAAEGLVG